jgi:hypothetical protein
MGNVAEEMQVKPCIEWHYGSVALLVSLEALLSCVLFAIVDTMCNFLGGTVPYCLFRIRLMQTPPI